MLLQGTVSSALSSFSRSTYSRRLIPEDPNRVIQRFRKLEYVADAVLADHLGAFDWKNPRLHCAASINGDRPEMSQACASAPLSSNFWIVPKASSPFI